MGKAQTPNADRPGLDKLIAKSETDYKDLKPWYVERSEKVYEVMCKKHGGVIALEVKWPGRVERGHVDGMIVIPLGNMLTSYRKRGDNTMGYACQCGASDITLAEEAILNETHALYPHVEQQIETALAARKKAPTSKFKRVKVK